MTIISDQFKGPSDFLTMRAFRSDYKVWDGWYGKVASVLFLSNILFMTRAYALSNLVETLLFLLFFFVPRLRRAFLDTVKDPVVIPAMLFFVWALISGLWGDGTLIERLDDWWGWRKLLLVPIGMVILSDARVRRTATRLGVAVALLFFCLALGAWLFEVEIIWERTYHSVLQNHNAQGAYFSIVAAALIMSAKLDRSGKILKIGKLVVGFGLLAFTIVLGSSRSGYVSAVISICAVTIYWFRGNFLALFLSAIFACGILFVSPFASERIQQAIVELQMGFSEEVSGYDSSGSIRAVMWKNTLHIIGENWLLGTGANGFKEAYRKQVRDQSGWRAADTDNPHSHYLHVWAEYGVVGLVLFSTFILVVFIRSDLSTIEGSVLFASVMMSSLIGVFDGVFGSAINGRIYLLCFVICLSHLNARVFVRQP